MRLDIIAPMCFPRQHRSTACCHLPLTSKFEHNMIDHVSKCSKALIISFRVRYKFKYFINSIHIYAKDVAQYVLLLVDLMFSRSNNIAQSAIVLMFQIV